MHFTSPGFIVFVTAAFMAFVTLPQRRRPLLLLTASIFLYGTFNIRFVPLILAMAYATYLCALRIAATGDERSKSLHLALAGC